jgi:hypothetical protein
MWETRRANKFLRAVKTLTRGGDVDELRLAAQEVGDWIAERSPAGSLPRGYAVVRNRLGEPSLARDGALLSPSFAEPPADAAAIEQLARDLSTGWLREVEVFLMGGGQ